MEKLSHLHKTHRWSTVKQLTDRIEEEKKKKPTSRALTTEENECADLLLRRGNDTEVISEIDLLKLTRYDIRTLIHGKWLNDEVINFYMEVLKKRQADNPQTFPKCHFFNTFFYQLLCNNNGTYSYQRVKRWTAKVDIFTYDKVLIPVHMGNHWCLSVINIKEKKLEYFDSLSGDNYVCLQKLRKYLEDEMTDKSKPGALNLTEFKDVMHKDIPHQSNGYDCGVFLCKYADFTSRGSPLNFTQKDITLVD
eukprot:gene6709-7802_t